MYKYMQKSTLHFNKTRDAYVGHNIVTILKIVASVANGLDYYIMACTAAGWLPFGSVVCVRIFMSLVQRESIESRKKDEREKKNRKTQIEKWQTKVRMYNNHVVR